MPPKTTPVSSVIDSIFLHCLEETGRPPETTPVSLVMGSIFLHYLGERELGNRLYFSTLLGRERGRPPETTLVSSVMDSTQ